MDLSVSLEIFRNIAVKYNAFTFFQVSMTTHGPCSEAEELSQVHVSIQGERTRPILTGTGIFDDPLFIKLLPAIVLKVILLSAICIACVLYKVRRLGLRFGRKRLKN